MSTGGGPALALSLPGGKVALCPLWVSHWP